MAKKKKDKKLKKQIRDTFVLTIIICILVFVLYKIVSLISSPTKTFVLRKNKISNEESKVGYVIREEYIMQNTDETRTIKPIVNEGEKVSANKPIFKFNNLNEEQIEKEIDELNKKIQEAMLEQKGLFPNDVKVIEGQIEKQLEKLKNENNMQNIIEYKSNVADYTLKKAKIAGSLSTAGEYINGLISERNQKEAELVKDTEYVYSNISGVVSYRIDGQEEKLKIDELDKLTTKYLNSLQLTTGQIVGKSSNTAKVINNFICYIAVPFETKEIEGVKEGQKATIRLSSQEEVKAEVFRINDEKNQALVIFKITDEVEKMINYRKISLDIIWWSYTGLMVPKEAILYENGTAYVMRKRNEGQEKIIVKVLKDNTNYCIIDNYSSKELAELGYTTDEINKIKTIKLYDEIIVNPEI